MNATATPRIAISGGTVIGNRGAEAMLTTVIGRIRDHYPLAEFCILSPESRRDRALLSDPRLHVVNCAPLYLVAVLFPLSVLGGLMRLVGLRTLGATLPGGAGLLAHCDMQLDIAGVAFMDSRIAFLPYNILTLAPAWLLGVPLVKLSQALGPFRRPLNRGPARFALTRCRRVFARGDETAAFLRELGLAPTLWEQAADVAFCNREGDSCSIENPERVSALHARLQEIRHAGNAIVGICPSAVIARRARREGWDYAGLLADVAEALQSASLHVVFFPNATRAYDAHGLRNNDLVVIQAVMQRLGTRGTGTHAVTFDINTDGIKLLLSSMDAALVSRFHAMVGALCMHTPVLVLGWSHKYAEVMQQFALEEWVLDYRSHDVAGLVARVRELVAASTALRTRIAEHLPQVREASYRQFAYVLAQLDAMPRSRGASPEAERKS